MSITIHTEADFEGMKKAGKLGAEILDYITDFVKPGVTTDELNKICHDKIIEAGAIPAPLGYRGFPKSICTSVNHVICHGIPDDKALKNGDIVKIDVTVIVDGWHGDNCRTYWVGEVSPMAKRLTQVTYEAMMKGIAQIRPGNRLGDVGHAIQKHAESFNYSVVRDYCGHGVGKVFHADPNVLHYGRPNEGLLLKEGMFFTVEPMVNVGKYDTKLNQQDGWTVTTRDRSLSAQFEHSCGVTKDGVIIFTKSPTGMDCPPFK
jgi:methionyl aminopeptidase